jgi:hypothetical protein
MKLLDASSVGTRTPRAFARNKLKLAKGKTMNLTQTLMAAAVSGILSGAVACGGESVPPPATPEPAPAEAPAAADAAPAAADAATDAAPAAAADATPAADGAKHACKGQNACKGQGGCKTDKNSCKGQNACKGQGGCKHG